MAGCLSGAVPAGGVAVSPGGMLRGEKARGIAVPGIEGGDRARAGRCRNHRPDPAMAALPAAHPLPAPQFKSAVYRAEAALVPAATEAARIRFRFDVTGTPSSTAGAGSTTGSRSARSSISSAPSIPARCTSSATGLSRRPAPAIRPGGAAILRRRHRPRERGLRQVHIPGKLVVRSGRARARAWIVLGSTAVVGGRGVVPGF